MGNYPPEVIAAVIEAMPGLTREHSLQVASEVLDAAAPFLGDFAASKILAHMEAHGPRPGTRIGGKPADDAARRAWRRHLGIAARIAARAFLTEDDEKRLAAETIMRGDVAVCDIPEVPGD